MKKRNKGLKMSLEEIMQFLNYKGVVFIRANPKEKKKEGERATKGESLENKETL